MAIRNSGASRSWAQWTDSCASGHDYPFIRHSDGTTDIDVVVTREDKTSKDMHIRTVDASLFLIH
jgi:hypothetical protein